MAMMKTVAVALRDLLAMHDQCICPPDETFLGIAELVAKLAEHAEGSLRSEVMGDYEAELDMLQEALQRR